MEHILTQCNAYSEIRTRLYDEFKVACEVTESNIPFSTFQRSTAILTQFILDPTSFNLTPRINFEDKGLIYILKVSRDFCYAINNERIRILKVRWLVPVHLYLFPNIIRSEWSRCIFGIIDSNSNSLLFIILLLWPSLINLYVVCLSFVVHAYEQVVSYTNTF